MSGQFNGLLRRIVKHIMFDKIKETTLWKDYVEDPSLTSPSILAYQREHRKIVSRYIPDMDRIPPLVAFQILSAVHGFNVDNWESLLAFAHSDNNTAKYRQTLVFHYADMDRMAYTNFKNERYYQVYFYVNILVIEILLENLFPTKKCQFQEN